jgi:2-hydroxymuconate-semialdehyde hydrolase
VEVVSNSSGHRATLLGGLTVTERRLDVNGVSTSILECGSGSPVILLHGAIECGGAAWAPVVARLGDAHHLVIPDMPGLGESDPVQRLDSESFNRWFEGLIALTCEAPPTVVAHSLGGWLALSFAVARPGLLDRLVVYAAPGIGPYRFPIGLMLTSMLYSIRPSEGNAERFDRRAFADYDGARRREPDWLLAFRDYSLAQFGRPHVKRAMDQLIKGCTKRIDDSALRGIDRPVGLIWGRHDRFVPLSLGEAASARLGWPLHIVEDAGHAAHIERPEAFVAGLSSTLDQIGPAC